MEFLMGSKAQLKLDVVCKIELGKMDRHVGCQLLNVTSRSLERYISRYRKEGPCFIKHGNQGRSPTNKKSDDLRKQVQELVRKKYPDFNMSHCLEKLRDDEKILLKPETFRKWCHEIRHVKRRKRRRPQARYRRERMQSTGLMLQMDGSPHKWFGQKDSTLISTIDDADSDIVYAEFFPAEDTISCMTVLQKVIERRGLFEILYVDRAGIFGGHKRMEFSQVKRALGELGIEIIFAQSPEAKGRIERSFQTLQDRIIPEMRIRNITTYPAANKFLQTEYLPNEWREKFTVLPRNRVSAYRKVREGTELKEVFCLKHHRSVKRDHTVAFQSNLYGLTSPTRFSIYKQQIEFRTYQDLTWKAFYAGREIELKHVEKIDRGESIYRSMGVRARR